MVSRGTLIVESQYEKKEKEEREKQKQKDRKARNSGKQKKTILSGRLERERAIAQKIVMALLGGRACGDGSWFRLHASFRIILILRY